MPTYRFASRAPPSSGPRPKSKHEFVPLGRRAIESEIDRQIDVVESGGRVVQETRGWDEARGVTISMRSKEQAHDYRYFPIRILVPME